MANKTKIRSKYVLELSTEEVQKKLYKMAQASLAFAKWLILYLAHLE